MQNERTIPATEYKIRCRQARWKLYRNYQKAVDLSGVSKSTISQVLNLNWYNEDVLIACEKAIEEMERGGKK